MLFEITAIYNFLFVTNIGYITSQPFNLTPNYNYQAPPQAPFSEYLISNSNFCQILSLFDTNIGNKIHKPLYASRNYILQTPSKFLFYDYLI